MSIQFFTRNIIVNIDKNTSKPFPVISEWWRVIINYESIIRKTCVGFYFRENQGTDIFSNKRLELIKISWLELMFKCPMINLLTFFFLSWLKLVRLSQRSLWPISLFPVLLVFKGYSHVGDKFWQLKSL